jgi:hypothetical protein
MKRHRTDTVKGAVKAAQNAALGPIEPPAHVTLRPADNPFWQAIMRARARDTWTDSDLSLAAALARAQADIERLQTELDNEGDVLTAGNGNPILNPKHKLLETITRRAISLARLLHVHAEATVGKSENASKALAAERAADPDDDDLIPTLRSVK